MEKKHLCENCKKCGVCHNCKRKNVIGLIGIGCAGSYILNKLSEKYKVVAFEAGWDRRNDGFTYNLAGSAPSVHNKTDRFAPKRNPPVPNGASEWNGIFLELPYTKRTVTEPASTLIGPLNWTQGIMVGGSNEHIQGVFVKPSQSRCKWWMDITGDDIYKMNNLFPLLNNLINFRMTTTPTTETFDGLDYAPLDGPSLFGSKPVNRGYNGSVQVTQECPSEYSYSLAKAIYNKFHDDLKYKCFKIVPIVENTKSKTYNSGVNVCVTVATERWIDQHRNRSSMARAFLNHSVMTNMTPSDPSIYGGYTNNGVHKGYNSHNFNLKLNSLVTRIVFKTKKCYPHGKEYWINNYNACDIKSDHFIKPLCAIGLVYCNQTNPCDKIFVKFTEVICSLGVLATPILLMQSGIGPSELLESLGIPVLFDQPNMGRHISNHCGTRIRWTGNETVWGGADVGTVNSNGYLPGPSGPNYKNRRKFQYYSGINKVNGQTEWNMSLYDLNTKSTGWIEPVDSGGCPIVDGDGTLLNLKIYPNVYSDHKHEDIHNLCWGVRQCAAAIVDADNTAVFTTPNIPYPFPEDDDVLFPILASNFTAQSHYVGSCGLGNDSNVHCVDTDYLLRGTKNVRVCDASSTPLEVECNGTVIYPVQNDGNTSTTTNVASVVFVKKMLENAT